MRETRSMRNYVGCLVNSMLLIGNVVTNQRLQPGKPGVHAQ